MKWFCMLACCISAQALAASNPEGAAWNPSLTVWGGLAQAFTQQQASLYPTSLAPASITASVSNAISAGAQLRLPAASWLTLGGDYDGSTRTLTHAWSQGSAQWQWVYVQPETVMGLSATWYPGAWLKGGDFHWGDNSNPAGWFWIPSLSGRLFHDSLQSQATGTDEVANASLGSHTDNINTTRYQLDMVIPLPEYYSVSADFGRDLWRDANYSQFSPASATSDTLSPSPSSSDRGNETWWGFSLKAYYNMPGGDPKRQWNPDGMEDSLGLAFNYGEFWDAQIRQNRSYGIAATYVASAWLSLEGDVDLVTYDTLPFNTDPRYAALTTQYSPNSRYSGVLRLKFYMPGTLARPMAPDSGAAASNPR